MPENQHNDPLERFFREKAREYNIQYKEDDWLKLEDRLDKLDEQQAQRNRRWMAAAAVILLFSVLAYITYDQQMKINQLNERLSQTENTVTLPGLMPEILSDIQNQDEGSQNESEETQRNEEQVAESETPAGTADRDEQSSETTTEREPEEFYTSQTATQTLPTVEIKENSLAAVLAKAPPEGDGSSPAISAITPPNFNASLSLRGDLSNRKSGESANTKSQFSNSRLSLGILLGPDISTVGSISNFYNPGHKIGMALEYNISRNLSVSVGALRSNVRYKASGNEYQPPSGYWTYGTTPDETLGQCILIDIPISLKYDFLHFSNSRLYATAGASSYIMLDEDYQFSYENNSSNLRQRWHEKTGTRHWMSNATLSVGYELDVSQTLSIRAEPFLKVPMKEVGWGNVKLYSMGTLVSLNYNFTNLF